MRLHRQRTRGADLDRVLVVLASAQRRGAEIQGESLGRRLAAAGYRCEVVALTRGRPGPALDVPVVGTAALSARTLLALRRRMRGALVIAHGSTTLPAVALASVGTRCLWWYRSIGDPGAWVRGPLHRLRTGLLMRRAARVIALWPGASDQITRLYRVPADRLTAIPNDRDPADFVPADPSQRKLARESLGISGPTVLLCGSLSEEKRPIDAVEVIRGLDHAVLLVAGTGPLEPKVRQAATDASVADRVRLVGAVDDVPALLAAADVLLLTSRTEGMPGIVIEALMSGLPIVATDVGSVGSMLVGEQSARCCPVGDIGAMRRAVAELIDLHPGSSVRAASRSAVEQFSTDRVFRQWSALVDAAGVEQAPPHTTR